MNPKDLAYTDQHEWIRLAGGVATVGITDHAQHALGDVTFVELPAVGAVLAKGDEACAIESAKAAASVFAPVGGKVVEVNSALDDDPGLVNVDCYRAGWIYKLQLADPAEVAALMSEDQYGKFLTEEPH
jgi:glycine cleavage system H protein